MQERAYVAPGKHPNSLANLTPWKPGQQPDRTGVRVNPGQSYLQWLAELGRVTPEGTAHYDTDRLKTIADDVKAPQEKRAAARDRIGMASGEYFKAQPLMANHIDRILDRTIGKPAQHVVLEAPPALTPEEALAKLRAFDAAHPELLQQIQQRALPPGQPA